MEKMQTRYISSFILEFISEFISYAHDKRGFSVEEIAILCLVVSESTRELRSNAFDIKKYGKEDLVLPNFARKAVSVKLVQMKLGLSRETARRRLESLAERNFLIKVKGGYIFPAQVGSDDYTKDLRRYISLNINKIVHYIKNIE